MIQKSTSLEYEPSLELLLITRTFDTPVFAPLLCSLPSQLLPSYLFIFAGRGVRGARAGQLDPLRRRFGSPPARLCRPGAQQSLDRFSRVTLQIPKSDFTDF